MPVGSPASADILAYLFRIFPPPIHSLQHTVHEREVAAMRVSLLDYGAGNVRSLINALEKLGFAWSPPVGRKRKAGPAVGKLTF